MKDCVRKNCHVITSSSLDEKWLECHKVKLDKIRFLYVGRANPERYL